MTAFRHFSRDSLPVTAWKNGGGTTQEIVGWPGDAALDDFGWRVSIATIAAAGPFSVFPGVDRSIVLLDGGGVRLTSRDGRIDHRLDVPHRPFVFSGDTQLDCSLLDGTSSDLNVMVRRGLWRAEVQVIEEASPIAASPHGVLLALRGHWRLNADAWTCRAGEGLCWSDDAAVRDAAPAGPGARLAVVRILAADDDRP